jgi:hypothetical protein
METYRNQGKTDNQANSQMFIKRRNPLAAIFFKKKYNIVEIIAQKKPNAVISSQCFQSRYIVYRIQCN